MARGPFQGTFQPNVRPTITVAPDAIVYINGESDVIACGGCMRKFDIHKYITSIQVDLNVDSCPGSASINLSVPRHSIDDVYFEGVPVISPMMEIEIYAKGYYLVEGVPQYYPIFWGFVTEVTDQYSSGQHTIAINCADILKWWELCKININPAWTAPKTAMGWDLFGNVFHGMNPYDVIWTLAQQATGDVVVGTGSLTSYNPEAGQQSTFAAALADLTLYWSKRFTRMQNNLLLYGAQGVAIRGATLAQKYSLHKDELKGQPFASQEVRRSNGGKYGGGMIFDPTSQNVVAFKTQFANAGQVNLWQSEYQTKLEIANAAKDAIGYEFYMDVTGDIVFKPPFYNLDTLPNKPVSWIQDIDIIDWDFSESESEVVTQVQMAGSFGGAIDYGMPQDIEPFTSVTDWHLLRKYGWRTHQLNSEFMGDPQLMFYYGMDVMDRLNARRHRGTVSIPLRPELRMGFPIYVAPKDQMWYVTGVSHNIQFGGSAQTTLTLTARRTKFFAPRGIGKLKLTGYTPPAVSKAATTGKAAPTGTVAAPETIEQNPGIFKYTARQLAEAAKFKIELGDAAVLPPEDLSMFDKPAAQNPYAPLILRHPKTGRPCGFPNVVMAYTRPFKPTKLPSESGVGGSEIKKVERLPKAAEDKARKTAEERRTTNMTSLAAAYDKSLQEGKSSALRVKYMQNRYQYGLNSAGVFTYLYDAGGAVSNNKPVVAETILLSAARISDDSAGFKTTSRGGMALIRPVSDERGFEVVGQFRYGRGLSLRDGSLVWNANQANQAASISLQTTLSGNLSDTLIAQSVGLRGVTTAFPNPARNLATLQPEDLETGATQFGSKFSSGTPTVTTPDYSSTATNLINSAPLGSTETLRIPDSIEATQLTRALTLAEMSVKGDVTGGASPCSCLLSRSDLAFMSQATKIEPVNGLTGAPVTLEGTTITTTGGRTDNRPVNTDTLPAITSDQVITKVNKYLFDLYKALDEPHQELEKALRGGDAPTTPGRFPDNDTGTPDSRFKPPFNDPARWAAMGFTDIAGMVDTAKLGFQEAVTTAADSFVRGTVIKNLEFSVARNAEALAQAQADLAKAQQAVPPVPQYVLDEAQARVNKYQQQLDEEKLKLAQAVNGGPLSDAAVNTPSAPPPEPTYGAGATGASKKYGK